MLCRMGTRPNARQPPTAIDLRLNDSIPTVPKGHHYPKGPRRKQPRGMSRNHPGRLMTTYSIAMAEHLRGLATPSITGCLRPRPTTTCRTLTTSRSTRLGLPWTYTWARGIRPLNLPLRPTGPTTCLVRSPSRIFVGRMPYTRWLATRPQCLLCLLVSSALVEPAGGCP